MSRRLSPGIIIILVLLAAFVVAAAGAHLLAHNDPLRQSLLLRLRPPGRPLQPVAIFLVPTISAAIC